MALKRRLQMQSHSFIATLPKALVEALGFRVGDELVFGIEGKKITIARDDGCQPDPLQASHQVKEAST